MGYVVSFSDYTPAARFDAVPYTHVVVQESATQTGTFSQIDDQPLVPVDLDPAVPQPRDVTTGNAVLDRGWYKLVFMDAVGNTSSSSAVYYNNIEPLTDAVPTVETIRQQTDVGFAEYGYPPPAPGDPDRLQFILDESVSELQYLLAQKSVVLDPAAVPNPAMALLVRRALRALVEYNVLAKQQTNVATASDFDMIQSQSIGPISESRRSISANANILHPWPTLNKLLLGIVSLANSGVLEGLDPNIPVFQSVEDRTDVQQPGFDLMYARRWVNSIFGELRPLGVYRPGWDGP